MVWQLRPNLVIDDRLQQVLRTHALLLPFQSALHINKHTRAAPRIAPSPSIVTPPQLQCPNSYSPRTTRYISFFFFFILRNASSALICTRSLSLPLDTHGPSALERISTVFDWYWKITPWGRCPGATDAGRYTNYHLGALLFFMTWRAMGLVLNELCHGSIMWSRMNECSPKVFWAL